MSTDYDDKAEAEESDYLAEQEYEELRTRKDAEITRLREALEEVAEHDPKKCEKGGDCFAFVQDLADAALNPPSTSTNEV